MECIGKGKAHKKFEFGVKVSVAVSNRGNFIAGMQAEPGNPYDGHTLAEAVAQVERITGQAIKRAFVDRGYRGHKLKAPQVLISGSKRGLTPQMKEELKLPKRDRTSDQPHEDGRQTGTQPPFGHFGRQNRLTQTTS